MIGGKGIKCALKDVYADALKEVFVTKPKRDKWMESTRDDIAKEWIADLEKENATLKEENERLYKDIRGLNSDLGRTLWNPQG